jgi:hypothetical protein
MRANVNIDPRIADKATAIQAHLRLVVGRNSHGLWVVREQLGRCGGLFTTRTEAIRFALQEASHGPGTVLISPETVELFPAFAGGRKTGRPVETLAGKIGG